MLYNIDSESGQSGCPVFETSNKARVVAIHSGYMKDYNLNIGVVITNDLIDDLKQWN
jgi:V8-like Glu-specific endopeptidase